MKALMFLALIAAAEIEETNKTGDQSPPAADPPDGRRFALEVEFSRVWESSERVRRFVRQGLRPRSTGKDDLSALFEKFESSGQASDPLHVACRVDGARVQPDGWLVVLKIGRIAYRDDVESRRRDAAAFGRAPRDLSWRIDSKTPDRKRAAATVIDDLSLAWRFPLTTVEERSVIEAQLVAAALVFLESRPLKVRLDPQREEFSSPEIDRLLDDVLPEEFPVAVADRVAGFIHEILARGVGPGHRALSPSGRFAWRGVPWELDAAGRARTAKGLVARARVMRVRSGLMLEESALLEGDTGHTIESRGMVVHAPRIGETRRFGATRWRVRREEKP